MYSLLYLIQFIDGDTVYVDFFSVHPVHLCCFSMAISGRCPRLNAKNYIENNNSTRRKKRKCLFLLQLSPSVNGVFIGNICSTKVHEGERLVSDMKVKEQPEETDYFLLVFQTYFRDTQYMQTVTLIAVYGLCMFYRLSTDVLRHYLFVFFLLFFYLVYVIEKV